MLLRSVPNQTLALAGVSQACWLVDQLATTGQADPVAMSASLESLLKIDAKNVPDVYGGISNLQQGLRQLETQLSRTPIHNQQTVRYAGQLIALQKKLSQQNKMQQTIHAGLIRAQTQASQFGILHENVLANFADLYFTTLSTMQPRVLVIGDQDYLNSPLTVNKIRSLLLAGIRSVHLWRQCGGTRWQLPFVRSKILAQTQLFLEEINNA
jgi:high frequency lysogenization protein